MPVTPPPVSTDLPVRWTVAGVEGLSGGDAVTRGLIENDEALQTSCTPADNKGEGKSIGIWGDYEHPSLDYTQRNIFAGTRLVYDKAHGDNPHNDWNYQDGHTRYWVKGGIYKFRAYYPAETIEGRITSNSSAMAFVVNCNTYSMQEDLLVAYKYVDTNRPLTDAEGNPLTDAEGKPVTSLSQYPVPLLFHHAYAALKFKFCFEEGHVTSDYLTSCHLENAVDGGGLYTLGMLAYTCEEGDVEKDRIVWEESYRPKKGELMYLWEHTGVLFSRTNADGGGETSVEAYAYSDDPNEEEVGSGVKSGHIYTHNDNWLLVIPQEVEANTLELCFTTRRSGDGNVYRVKLPAITYERSKRYTYNVTLTRTDVALELSIADWNELDSSTNIDF